MKHLKSLLVLCLLVAVAFLDILFFLSFTIAFQQIFVSTAGTLDEMNSLMKEQTQNIQENRGMQAAMVSAEVQKLMKVIFMAIIKIFLALLVLWTLFEGSAWFLIGRFQDNSASITKHILRILCISVLGLVGVALLVVSMTSLLHFAGEESTILTVENLPVLTGIPASMLLWLMFTTYSRSGSNTKGYAFVKNCMQALPKTAVPFFAFLLSCIAGKSLIMWALQYSLLRGFIVLLLIVFPLAVITRVWIAACAAGRPTLKNLLKHSH